MTIETIYVARHGYRANWLPPPHPPNPTGIDSDPPLAAHGVEQAKQLAEYINSFPEEEKPGFILSSPFYRCVQTTEPISDALSVKVGIDRGVGEWYKKQRGIIPEPANYDTLSKFFHCLADSSYWDRDRTVGVVPNESGETEEDIYNRASEFWKTFIPTFEERFPNVKNILIVTHAATKIALGITLLKRKSVYDTLDDQGSLLRAGACSLDKYVKKDNRWIITMNGNCDFLKDGEEMNWDFHSKFEAGSDEDIKARKEAAEKKEIDHVSKVSSSEANAMSEGDPVDSKQYEDFFVTIDIPVAAKSQNFEDSNNFESTISKINLIRPSSQFQITDINNESPLVKISNRNLTLTAESNTNDIVNNLGVIDGKIFETNWKRLVGTDLIFDDYGEFIGKVQEHLTCNESTKILPKENEKASAVEELEPSTRDIKEEKTTFLKKAINYAKSKNSDVDDK